MIKRMVDKLKSIYHYILKYGHHAFDETGKSKIIQFFEILWFRRKGFHESEYYILSIYKGDKNFVSLKAHGEAVKTLNPPVRGQIEFNKYIFGEYLQAHGLPVPQCYGILQENFGFTKTQHKLKNIEDLRKLINNIMKPLVLKPVGDTSGGVGVFSVEKYDPQTDMVSINGELSLSLNDFYQKLDAVNTSGILIQDKIIQHPDLSKIHPASVNCVRIYSIINEMYEPEVFGAVVKFGSGGAVVDNSKLSGGVFSKVDIETGILGYSYDFYDPEPMENHPFTNERIMGLQLPFWNDVVQLTKKAHFILPFAGSFGWDIALGENGPVIIEVNGNWDHNHFQKAMQKSLKDTKFEQVLKIRKK